MPSLSVSSVYKTYNQQPVLSNITFDVERGEIIALLGPSGSGKTTLLNIIAGIEKPDLGDILWEGQSLVDVPPHQRGFGLMFQDFMLFPHMNVYNNIAFSLRMNHLDEPSIRQKVQETLELVGLPEFDKRDVNTLSGGEQQRIALGRSLAHTPRLLMLDEPLGSLDRNLRERLLVDIHNILKQLRLTAIYVTHDQEEAFSIADRIVLLHDGQIEQIATPESIYRHPSSPFVARFLGLSNLITATIQERNGVSILHTEIGDFPINPQAKQEMTVLLRPDSVSLEESRSCMLQGVIISKSFRGNIYQISLLVNGIELAFELPSHNSLPNIGEQLVIYFNPANAFHFFEY